MLPGVPQQAPGAIVPTLVPASLPLPPELQSLLVEGVEGVEGALDLVVGELLGEGASYFQGLGSVHEARVVSSEYVSECSSHCRARSCRTR